MRRDISLRMKERIYQAAFVFLVLFAVMVIFNDLQNHSWHDAKAECSNKHRLQSGMTGQDKSGLASGLIGFSSVAGFAHWAALIRPVVLVIFLA